MRFKHDFSVPGKLFAINHSFSGAFAKRKTLILHDYDLIKIDGNLVGLSDFFQ